MMMFGILGSVSIVLFLVICAIASSDKWNDEIQRHLDRHMGGGEKNDTNRG